MRFRVMATACIVSVSRAFVAHAPLRRPSTLQKFCLQHSPQQARLTRRLQSTSSNLMGDGAIVEEVEEKKIPVTLLSGFLGAGKTTLLQQVLKRALDENIRVGVVVNDVAAVNVDSKLVRSPFEDYQEGGAFSKNMELRPPEGREAEFVELGDGCICCSIADELFSTLSELVAVAKYRGFKYDHIIIESTGVAEPRSIRDTFQDAVIDGMPLMQEIQLDTLVTVVDSADFLEAYSETRPVASRPDLAARPEDAVTFIQSQYDGSLRRSVVDLLLEQVECADVVLLNKADLLDKNSDDLARLEIIVSALNSQASVRSCVRGDTPLAAVLATAGGNGIAAVGPVDEHKFAVKSAETKAHEDTHDEDHTSHSHAHAEDHTSHSHAHAEDHTSHSHAHAEDAVDSHSKKESSHSHSHAHAEDATDSHTKKESSHSHSHAHAEDAADCEICNEEHSHSHTHSHDRSASATTAEERFGINSFVYSRRRPFEPARLQKVIRQLPADVTAAFNPNIEATQDDQELTSALKLLVRSKGFMWLASSHDAAFYWSHAGKFFDAPILGRWWATLPREYWPADQVGAIEADFEGQFGDRRQEIVFIGLDAITNKAIIEEALDACLLDDDEFNAYVQLDNEDARKERFPSDLLDKPQQRVAA